MELMYYDEIIDEWCPFDEEAIENLKDHFGENEHFTLEFRFIDLDDKQNS